MKHPHLKWSGLALNGSAAVLIGLVFIFLPNTLIETLVQISGGILAVSGIAMLIFTFFINKAKVKHNIYYLFQGILNLGVGALMLFQPVLMIEFIFFIIGLWALAIGLFQMIFAFQIKKLAGKGWLFLLGNGLAFSLLGVLMTFYPNLVIVSLLSLIGIMVSLLGVILLYFSYLVFKSNQFQEAQVVDDKDAIQ